MTSPANWQGGPSPVGAATRWLVVPGLLGLFILVSLAISSERHDDTSSEGSQRSGAIDSNESGDGSGSFEPRPTNREASDLDEFEAEVSADDGLVAVDLAGDVPAAQTITNTGRVGPPVTLDASTDDDHAGLRLVPDGSLQPVAPEEIEPGDLVVAPNGSGIDVVGADGTRIEIRATGNDSDSDPDDSSGSDDQGGELSATRVDPDGSSEPISPDEEGRIDAGDGVIIQLPPPADGSIPWRLLLAALLLVIIAGLVVRHLARRSAEPEPFGVDFVGPSGIPPDRFDEFLAMLSEDPDPARAIRLAFLAAERGLQGLSPRRSTETPFEWATRIAGKRPDVVEPLGRLASRFAATRFGGESPTPSDRDFVVEQLRHLEIAARSKPVVLGS